MSEAMQFEGQLPADIWKLILSYLDLQKIAMYGNASHFLPLFSEPGVP
jgi:hypothetical protein